MVDESPATTFHGLRVHGEDTDAGGVVFHANDLKFLERARAGWLRARGAELRTDGEVRVGCVDENNLRPWRIPMSLLERLRA